MQLALKHRENKTQRQRIVVFTCSPIAEDEKALVKLAKKMKKSGVTIDFVAFGELDDDITKKLTAFNEAVKSGDNSHMVTVPQGPGLLSDHLLSTPIINPDAPAGGAGDGGDAGAGAESFEFGIDPSIDPELALALRMSMEEESSRQEKIKKAEAEKNKEKPETIQEGKEEESQPLLDSKGEASESKDGKKDEDPDKMDIN